jgi:hypothetical protein
MILKLYLERNGELMKIIDILILMNGKIYLKNGVKMLKDIVQLNIVKKIF